MKTMSVSQQPSRPSRWEKLFAWLPHLYRFRVVGLTGLVVAILPFTQWTPAEELLGGLFDLDRFGLFLVTLTVSILVLSLMVIARLILINGNERFEADRFPTAGPDPAGIEFRTSAQGFVSYIVFGVILGLFTGGTMYFSGLPPIVEILPVLLGFLAAFYLSQLALLLYHRLLPPSLAEYSPEILEPFRVWFNFTAPLFGPAKAANLPGRLRRWLKRSIQRIPPHLGRGYFQYENGTAIWLYPGHIMAIVMFLVTLGVYIWIWYAGSEGPIGSEGSIQVPALVYALVLITMICWTLSLGAFFFDRYRFPLLFLLLLLGSCSGLTKCSDYYYSTLPQTSPIAVLPEHVVREDTAMIVVAANGGGIQSAVWTAQVLTGLEEASRDSLLNFGQSVRFISAVSGGSVGAMYFVNAYTEEGLPRDTAQLRQVVRRAATSSLSDVAWGFAYPDLIRSFFPFVPPMKNRGQALQAAWSRTDDGLERDLSSWREGVRAGWRPATVFNATIADTGERLLFSTADPDTAIPGGQVFSGFNRGGKRIGLYPGHDVSIATAARLSASFPYVTPAARAMGSGPDVPTVHIVDGGYYDNYGMVTLVEWLDRALKRPESRIKKVLVLQIRGASGSADPLYQFRENAPPNQCPKLMAKDEKKGPHNTMRGWFYQTFAPVATLLHVRETGQIAHNNNALGLLQRTWQKPAGASGGKPAVQIATAVFQYHGADPPLSWHLTAQQREDIRRHWAAHLQGCYGDQLAKFKDFLRPGAVQ